MASNETSEKVVQLLIKGRVQGVWYRGWAVDNAVELGLHGWVRNRRDGKVEAVFAGDSANIELMIERCWQGPSYAQVTNIETSNVTEAPGDGFHIRATF